MEVLAQNNTLGGMKHEQNLYQMRYSWELKLLRKDPFIHIIWQCKISFLMFFSYKQCSNGI
jgi:hypothetical protein